MSNNFNNLQDTLSKISSFEILKGGEKELIFQSNPKFQSILNNLENLFLNSMLMPAFGVCSHKETEMAIRKDVWLKINYNENIKKNTLPFTALIFQLDETVGFNLIREFNGEYGGRCLYLNLDKKFDLKSLIN
jgi:hypothetical protein